jgi:hypothetical protein
VAVNLVSHDEPRTADILDLPADRTIDRLAALLGPVSRLTRPKVYGVEHLPTDGSLLVGNHTIYGLLDLAEPPAARARR